jgi:hypothetical protein
VDDICDTDRHPLNDYRPSDATCAAEIGRVGWRRPRQGRWPGCASVQIACIIAGDIVVSKL